MIETNLSDDSTMIQTLEPEAFETSQNLAATESDYFHVPTTQNIRCSFLASRKRFFHKALSPIGLRGTRNDILRIPFDY